ncbi:MAG: polyprenyl synthetase family protein [Saprospiraceae bacterium]
MQDIKQFFEDYRLQHPFDGQPFNLYEPANYIMNLGGKRFRPILTILAYRLFREDLEKVLPVANALEIFHNFSLVHDDIMDEAKVRRGFPTVHTKWDLNTGILSGDVMLVLAYEYLAQFSDEAKIPALLRVFNRVAREVCEGQQMDIDFEQRSDVTIEEYIRMIELKTSVLLATCLEMGAIAAGASAEEVQHCYAIGRNIGIAFQLQDDLLDTFGTAEKIGKRVGGDIIQNKKTFLILKALELASPTQQQLLADLMDSTPEDESAKIEQVKAILMELNIPKHAQEKKNEFRSAAFEHLEVLQVPEEQKAPIRNLMEKLVSRDH